jgi:2-oxoglutarate ferredoxin oxidoreductase subunit beta
MSSIQDFTSYTPTWCPGCGNYGIGVAIKSALVKLNLSPSDIFVVFGIGCSGNMNDFLNAYAVHSLHGRAIPTAIGMKITNHKNRLLLLPATVTVLVKAVIIFCMLVEEIMTLPSLFMIIMFMV